MAKKDKKTIDLPEVKDIPGQENIKPLRLGELADTTASSSDEEGDDILDQDDDLVGSGSNVSREERRVLANIDNRELDTEDEVLNEAALDTTDDDGDPLNEGSFGRNVTGHDLDVPGAEDDDADEDVGAEDEENNEYSIDKNEDDSDINYDA
ncbi:hypothetical protein [Puia sp.]|jgi:hypothetical protein|uniref:hypothetical protein n=1 Tax=Puia sp. TaxID=2045100 RepID=UPI002F40A76C